VQIHLVGIDLGKTTFHLVAFGVVSWITDVKRPRSASSADLTIGFVSQLTDTGGGSIRVEAPDRLREAGVILAGTP
jgi:hypothetical protein